MMADAERGDADSWEMLIVQKSGFSLYHGTAVFFNCGKGQPPKAMGFWRRVVRPTGFEPAAFRVGV